MPQENEILHGFRVTRIRDCRESGGTMIELKHEKTGGEVCFLDNGENNKLFAIAFKTLPEDDTGVFHILEHTTLCGSEKYPVREPFVELLKSSMNTFLNAMTAGDYTIYPVSSRSTRDYLNLVSVYLDAVFAPRLLHDDNIFYQEGWHITEDADGKLSYKGVVFNEMKGDMSSQDSVIDDAFDRLLFPDTCLRFNSGGDPRAIPGLTLERYRDTYRRFYHPSNARVYLDGRVPLEETLRLLDSYYSRYEAAAALPEDQLQIPKAGRASVRYELPAGEDLKDKGCLVMGKLFGTYRDRVRSSAARILFSAIGGSNEAPLKKAVLDAGLARSVLFSVDGGYQNCVSVTFKDVPDGREEELYRLVRETAERLCREGLDREELEAGISRVEFAIRDAREPAGLYRGRRVLSTWLYGGDPMERLCFDDTLRALSDMIPAGGYEALLKELLVDEEGMCRLTALPSRTLGEELQAEEESRLEKIRAGWEKADLEANRALNRALTAWQQTPETPEQLATLPVLPISEVTDAPDTVKTDILDAGGVRVLFHPAACPGIVHIRMYFPLSDYSLEDLTRLQLITSMFGQLPTKNTGLRDLRKRVKALLGRESVGIQLFSARGERKKCIPCLSVYFAALESKAEPACRLVSEILRETLFTDTEQVLRLTEQTAVHFRQMPAEAGHLLGIMGTLSPFSAEGAVNESINGSAFVRYLSGAAEEIRGNTRAFLDLTGRLQRETLTRERMLISVTGTACPDLSSLVLSFARGQAVPWDAAYSRAMPPRTVIRIPAQISYAVRSWQVPLAEGEKVDGGWVVAANIISLNYLWNTVRVQGGAYGCSLVLDLNGSLTAYSYRDPTPARTMVLYGGMEQALRDFCREEGDRLDSYILSTIAEAEPLKTPMELGAEADQLYLTGLDEREILRVRSDMLRCTKETLLAFADLLHLYAEQSCECTAGPEAVIRAIPDAEELALS